MSRIVASNAVKPSRLPPPVSEDKRREETGGEGSSSIFRPKRGAIVRAVYAELIAIPVATAVIAVIAVDATATADATADVAVDATVAYLGASSVREFANAKYGLDVSRCRPSLVTMLLATIALFLLATGTTTAEIFTNTFLVRMRQPAERHVADRVALRNGFVNLGPVSSAMPFERADDRRDYGRISLWRRKYERKIIIFHPEKEYPLFRSIFSTVFFSLSFSRARFSFFPSYIVCSF